MKKRNLIMLGLIALTALVSCGNETSDEPKVIEKKETVVVEKQAPAQKPNPEPTKESDGTSISANKSGVEISTKDGKNKTEIKLGKNGGSLKIEK